MNSGKKVLLGVLAGIATGALLGILFAPAKGSDTRKKIAEKGEDYTDALEAQFNEFLRRISGKLKELKIEVPVDAEPVKVKSEKPKKGVKTATA